MKTVQLSNGRVMQYPDDWDWDRIKADLDRQYPEAGRKSQLATAAVSAQYPQPNEADMFSMDKGPLDTYGPMREGYGRTVMAPPQAADPLTEMYRQQRIEAGLERLKYGREIGSIEWPKYDVKDMSPFETAAVEALSLLGNHGEELDALPETYLGRAENPRHVRLAAYLKRMQERQGDPETDWVNYFGEKMPLALPALMAGSPPAAAAGVLASPIVKIMNMRRVRHAAERYVQDKASDEDLITLAFAIREQQRLSKQGMLRRALDVSAEMPQFATEVMVPYSKALGAGRMVGQATRSLRAVPVAGQLLRGTAKWSGAEFVGKMAARGAATAAWNPQRVLEFAEARRLYENEDQTKALLKGFADATIEYGSETFGQLLPRSTVIKGLTKWLKTKGRFANMTPFEFRKAMNRAGLQGVLMEIAEEQVASLARGLTVTPGDFGKWSANTWGETIGQLMEEFLVFLPLAGVGAMAQLGTTRKEWLAIAEARMQARAAKEAEQYFAELETAEPAAEPAAEPTAEPAVTPTEIPIETPSEAPKEQLAETGVLDRIDVTPEEILDQAPGMAEQLLEAEETSLRGQVSRKQFADITGIRNQTFEQHPRAGAYRQLISDTVQLARARAEQAQVEATTGAATQVEESQSVSDQAASSELTPEEVREDMETLYNHLAEKMGHPPVVSRQLQPRHYKTKRLAQRLGVQVEFFEASEEQITPDIAEQGRGVTLKRGRLLMLPGHQTTAQNEQVLLAHELARAGERDRGWEQFDPELITQYEKVRPTRTRAQRTAYLAKDPEEKRHETMASLIHEFMQNPDLRRQLWAENRAAWDYIMTGLRQAVGAKNEWSKATQQMLDLFVAERGEWQQLQAKMEIDAANRPEEEPNGQWGAEEEDKKKASVEPDASGQTGPMGMPLKRPPSTVFTMDMPMTLTGPPPKHRICTVPQIFRQLHRIAAAVGSNAQFRFGLMGRLGKRFKGWYHPALDTARLRDVGDIPAAAHELGHAVDWHYFVTGPIAGKAEDFDAQWRAKLGNGAADELEAAGHARYTDLSRPPAGGYLREGFAEFVRVYLTNPEQLPTLFPTMTPWFETQAQGALLKEMRKGQRMITEYRTSGAWARDEAARVNPHSARYKLQKITSYFRSTKLMEDWIEVFYPLKLMDAMADEYRRKRGLPPRAWNERLYETAKYTRGMGASWTHFAKRFGPIDIDGKPMDARPLQDVSQYVHWDEAEHFKKYLAACRTLARAGQPVQMLHESEEQFAERRKLAQSLPAIATHMDVADAAQLVKDAEAFFDQRKELHPHGKDDLRAAAEIYWRFRNAVLTYCGQVSETARRDIELVQQLDPGNYIGIAFQPDEEFDPHMRGGKGGSSVTTGAIVKRQRGYRGQVTDLLEASFKAMQRQVDSAWRMRLAEQVARIASVDDISGVGKWIEPVERAMEMKYKTVKEELLKRIHKDLVVRDQDGNVIDTLPNILEELHIGKASLAIDDHVNQMVEFWAPARDYRGHRPVVIINVPIKDVNGKVIGKEPKWFYVNPALHRILVSPDATWHPYGNAFVDGMLGIMRAIAKVWKFSTVGIRPAFNLIRNPVRDVRTFLYQTTDNNPARALWCWAQTLGSETYHLFTEQPSDFHRLLMMCGGIAGQPLTQDVQALRTAAHDIFGKTRAYYLDWHNVGKILKDGFSEVVDRLQFMERVPRIAELKMRVQRYNRHGMLRQTGEAAWQFGDPTTLEMLKDLRLASSEITIDFLAGGRITQSWNAYMPFFNVAFQSKRTTWRVFHRDPQRFIKYLSIYAAYVLGMWYLHKDDEDYKEADNRKYLYDHFFFTNPVTGEREVLMLARDHEMGVMLSILEGLVDSTYRSMIDNELDPEPFVRAIVTYANSSLPSLAPPLALEVWEQGRNKDSWTGRKIASGKGPPEQQYTEYTTGAAITMGRILGVSPARLDHAIEGLFGATSVDILRLWTNMVGQKRTVKDFALSDIPVAGSLFKKGGALGYRPRSVEQVWEERDRAEVAQYDVERPETARQRQRRLMLFDATRALAAYDAAKRASKERDVQQQLTRAQYELAKKVLADLKEIDQRQAPVPRERIAAARRQAQRIQKQVAQEAAQP